MPEFRQLRYFTAIVDAGSLTRAAAVLFVAQPALSQQTAALEAELGVRLLNRSSKGVIPTEAGWALYRHAQAILKLAERTQDIVRGAGEPIAGRVRIGMPSTIAIVLVAPLVAALRKQHPGVILEVYESPSSYLAPQLLEERVDLSILVDPTVSSTLRAVALVDEELCFVHARADHPFGLSTGPTTLDRLAHVPIVLPARSTTLRQLVDASFVAAGIVPRVHAETTSIQTLLTLVAQGGVGTFVPYSALAWHKASDLLWANAVEPTILRKAWVAQSSMIALTQAAACVHATILAVVRGMVSRDEWRGAILRC